MDLTLVVLAAGMGSRFGGLKQLVGLGPCGETLLDYSVYDALRAGFNRLVFVIRRDFEAEFREKIVSRYRSSTDVELVFQEANDLPGRRVCRMERQKPWGTGHAVWVARHAVTTPFLVVNADDFYGAAAYATMARHLHSAEFGGNGMRISLVAYRLGKTLSESGSVSRGVCTVDTAGHLVRVVEHTQIARGPDGKIFGLDAGGSRVALSEDTLVSMNFWGFSRGVFEVLEERFANFLDAGGLEDARAEFYIPSAVTGILSAGQSHATVLTTGSQWLGVTYREDAPRVAVALAGMVRRGEYPSPLM
jgi:dTDP-glucose pyrophosphorylase